MEKLRINLKEIANLSQVLKESGGVYLSFSNGCSIEMAAKHGSYYGENPKGDVWVCPADGKAVTRIERWLDFWSEEEKLDVAI